MLGRAGVREGAGADAASGYCWAQRAERGNGLRAGKKREMGRGKGWVGPSAEKGKDEAGPA